MGLTSFAPRWSLEGLADIRQRQDRRYAPREVAEQAGYVRGSLTLLHHGEARLLIAVENGCSPLNAASELPRGAILRLRLRAAIGSLFRFFALCPPISVQTTPSFAPREGAVVTSGLAVQAVEEGV
ncbi:hypothetical protein LMG28690_03899 [Paraburkholderia caffeinilytica]|nr:hypothetical protein LMG28690_03899 [Paraburkholderia caffeinilytica]